ncbi:MAG: hypothetical protein K2X47_11905 [Bdellovibrionales bacterium]|nr:hypothetical protein [Bdellovibrionales bacterium]
MILKNPEQLRSWLSAQEQGRRPHTRPADEVLMVSPEHFRVDYAINPYMSQADGRLQKIDTAKAKNEWLNLKATYERTGFPVHVINGDSSLPDMVFAANQSFPFLDPRTGAPSVLLSEMRSPFRKPEVQYFETFYKKRGYQVYSLKNSMLCCEGNGDLLLHPSYPLVFAGFGPRTDHDALYELSERFGLTVYPIRLLSEDFYHLDTCLSILRHDCAMIQSSAFPEDARRALEIAFPNLVEIAREENRQRFVCNAHSPNGRDIISHPLSEVTAKRLQNLNFQTHTVDTSEFIKSGGSVFCLKMMIWSV